MGERVGLDEAYDHFLDKSLAILKQLLTETCGLPLDAPALDRSAPICSPCSWQSESPCPAPPEQLPDGPAQFAFALHPPACCAWQPAMPTIRFLLNFTPTRPAKLDVQDGSDALLLGSSINAATASGLAASLAEAGKMVRQPTTRHGSDKAKAAFFARDYALFLKMQRQQREFAAAGIGFA